jgi:Plant transposon protein
LLKILIIFKNYYYIINKDIVINNHNIEISSFNIGFIKIICTISPVAFIVYFQMGDSTGLLCLKTFCHILCINNVLQEGYICQMNRLDAFKVTALHKEVHGVEGMIGSLDCMHVGWENCPLEWHRKF